MKELKNVEFKTYSLQAAEEGSIVSSSVSSFCTNHKTQMSVFFFFLISFKCENDEHTPMSIQKAFDIEFLFSKCTDVMKHKCTQKLIHLWDQILFYYLRYKAYILSIVPT